MYGKFENNFSENLTLNREMSYWQIALFLKVYFVSVYLLKTGLVC